MRRIVPNTPPRAVNTAVSSGPATAPRSVTEHRAEIAPTILIVDDSPVNVELLARILRTEGFRAIAAQNGDQALARCAADAIDLILLDVMLPGRSGLQVCSELKSAASTSDIPIVFLSALDDVEHRVAGLRAGGVDYISKPFHAEEVLARVRAHLRTRMAMECAMRNYRSGLEELRQAQQSILVQPEDVPEGCFAAYYRPLEAVGGDFYDVVPVSDDVMGYFVADISGHGVGASFLTCAVKALLRQYSGPLFSVEDTMREINSVMRATLNTGQFLTACYARLYRRSRKLSIVGAGHLPVIHAGGGRVEAVAMESDPLGVFGSVTLHRQDIKLQPGDRFYLYTDGLIEDYELPAGGRGAGLESLMAACKRGEKMPLAEAIRAIVADVRPPGSPVTDDLLLLGAEVKG